MTLLISGHWPGYGLLQLLPPVAVAAKHLTAYHGRPCFCAFSGSAPLVLLAQLIPARCCWLLQVSGGADLFVGFGGVVQRPAVAAEADWYIYDYQQLLQALKRYTVREHLQSLLLHDKTFGRPRGTQQPFSKLSWVMPLLLLVGCSSICSVASLV
jgi:hypothetical protein